MMQKLKENATFFEALKWASFCLQQKSLEKNGARYVMLAQMKWNLSQLLLYYRDKMTKSQQQQYVKNIARLLNGEPAQYVVGKSYFYGNLLVVNNQVLIPRPETEELVTWVLNDYKNNKLNVLDLGTGSGAIAIALKRQRPSWKITGTDISQSALNIAKQNAINNGVKINFKQSDVFQNIIDEKYDVIISNPPYIADDEVKYMDESTLNYEPHEALFAKNNGLQIYEEIAKQVSKHLQQNGSLYLEIGFHQGQAVSDLLKTSNLDAKISLRQDLAGNDRMVKMDIKGD